MDVANFIGLTDIELQNCSVIRFPMLNGLELHSKEETIDLYLQNESAVRELGLSTIRVFRTEPYFFMPRGYTSDVTEAHIIAAFDRDRNIIGSIVPFLWFVKDNSVNWRAQVFTIKGGNLDGTILNLVSFTNSRGEHEKVGFTGEEMQIAFDYWCLYNKLSEVQKQSSVLPDEASESGFATSRYYKIEHNDKNAIDRVVEFLTLARTTSFLGVKVSFYISILEVLFGERIETAHKVCERTALYIGTTFEDRKAIYKQIGQAYDFRSAYIHGGTFEKKEKNDKAYKVAQQRTICTELDTLLRKLLIKVLVEDHNHFLKVGDQRSEYFKALLFQRDYTLQ